MKHSRAGNMARNICTRSQNVILLTGNVVSTYDIVSNLKKGVVFNNLNLRYSYQYISVKLGGGTRIEVLVKKPFVRNDLLCALSALFMTKVVSSRL